MQLIQSIPFFCIFSLFLLNLRIKRKFFCISSLALLFISSSMFCSIFLVARPRTGVPYVRLDAMLFLSACFVLLCLPALFFKDGKKDAGMKFMDLPDNLVRFITRMLCLLTVPASIVYSIQSIPLLIDYLSGSQSRGQFRAALPEFGGGLASIENFLLTLGASFSLIAFFWAIYCIAMKKQKAWSIALLIFGALGPCIDSLKMVSRVRLFANIVFCFVVVLMLFLVISPEYKKKLKRFCVMAALLLLVPFMAISIARFKDDLGYSLISYFSTGPYSFNVDYAARTEGGVKPLNGFITFGWHLFVYEKVTGQPVYQQAFEQEENYYWGGDSGRGTDPQTYNTYRRISGAFSGEFKTAAGTFLQDYDPGAALLFCIFLSSIVCFVLIRCKNWSVSVLLFASIYFYCLFIAPFFWAFTRKTAVFALLLICTFSIWLYVKQRRYTRESTFSSGLVNNECAEAGYCE